MARRKRLKQFRCYRHSQNIDVSTLSLARRVLLFLQRATLVTATYLLEGEQLGESTPLAHFSTDSANER